MNSAFTTIIRIILSAVLVGVMAGHAPWFVVMFTILVFFSGEEEQP